MCAAIPHVSVHFIQFSRFVSLLSSRLVHFSSIILLFLFFAAFYVSLFLALVAFLSCHSVASLHSNPFIEPGFLTYKYVSMCITVWHIHTYHYVSFCSIQFPSFFPTKLTTQSWPLRAHNGTAPSQHLWYLRHALLRLLRSQLLSHWPSWCWRRAVPQTKVHPLWYLMLRKVSAMDIIY